MLLEVHPALGGASSKHSATPCTLTPGALRSVSRPSTIWKPPLTWSRAWPIPPRGHVLPLKAVEETWYQRDALEMAGCQGVLDLVLSAEAGSPSPRSGRPRQKRKPTAPPAAGSWRSARAPAELSARRDRISPRQDVPVWAASRPRARQEGLRAVIVTGHDGAPGAGRGMSTPRMPR